MIEMVLMSSVVEILQSVRSGNVDDETLKNKAIELARIILEKSNAGMTSSEKKQAAKLARMMNDAPGKALTLAMADQVFRPFTYTKQAERFADLINGYGVPQYLSGFEQFAMKMGARFAPMFPDMVMPRVLDEFRKESSGVILPSEDGKLRPHLRKRKAEGMRMNINQLGEAILGEEEAAKRLEMVIDRLKNPDCEYISVKISSILSQINLIDFEGTVSLIQERLRTLFRTAMEYTFKDAEGKDHPKFINLDMEEYRDLHLTCEAFKRTLMEPEFLKLEAGIVLQAYLPDSSPEQVKLTDWAKERVAKGGAIIKLRIVKGANLAMETVDASMHDWPLAPYESKAEVDANFKRMVQYACRPENAKIVHLGLASHNLFDLCYGMLLREANNVREYVEFEMLEGMSDHMARVVCEEAEGLLLYAPVVKKEDFHAAIAYLIRRLDENTSEENYLHDTFGMSYGSREWEIQKRRFARACDEKDAVKEGPSRKQNRMVEKSEPDYKTPFHNAPDTDWSLPHNQEWIQGKVEAQRKREIQEIPLVINGQEEKSNIVGVGRDPSKAGERAYSFCYADHELVGKAIESAVNYQGAWAGVPLEERRKLLKNVAAELSNSRGELIAAMVMDGGKAIPEGDGEVSEAIDFANYYADSLTWEGLFDGTEFKPLGTILVAPPWNFPTAIPCGSALSALMAGNTVIFKPAPETVYVSWVMINCLWKAGIPREALQFVAAPDNEIGQKLVMDERVNGVVLTGAWETGKMFQDWKPDIRLFAETSGKNSLIVTTAADPDQAVKDLVKSAFGHAGQKCSAASLAILQAPVYDNEVFRRQLKDAAASLKVGMSWEPSSLVTPIIREPSDELRRALTSLDEGEEWLLEPQMIDNNPCLWSPGIKLGVRPDSWYRRTECFGPVLGLIRVETLEEAINIQNDSDFGLTGGIHTLDDKEIELWRKSAQVGNAYINRPITGAIVRRQPFGGWKKSCFGPGAKAGGPNYVAQFGVWSEKELPNERLPVKTQSSELLKVLCDLMPDSAQRLRAASASQAKWYKEEFGVEHDPSQIYGEINIFRYVPVKSVLFRVENVSDEDIAIALMAAIKSGVPVELSLETPRKWMASVPDLNITEETEAEMTGRLGEEGGKYGFLRMPGAGVDVYKAVNEVSLPVLDMPVLANGRLELLRYHREQAVSETTHRYGNIVPKPSEVAGK